MRVALVITLAALFAGCGVELLATTATVSELQAEQLKSIKGQVQGVSESQGRIHLQRAIDTYYAEKGAYPQSLDQLAPGWIPAVPVHANGSPYGYDPLTGRISDTPVTSSDPQKIAQIQAAITRFGQATGFYPMTLDALVPQYLPQVPLSASGLPFIYDNQNGFVGVPTQPNNTPAPAGYAPAGAGPMGEVMTGIGIQQQLGNMNNAGTSAAGTHLRNGIGNATTQHNTQQEQALESMGY